MGGGYTYVALDGSGKTFKESWPTTARIKFSCRFVQWCATTSTFVCSLPIKFVVLSSAWEPRVNIPREIDSTSFFNSLFDQSHAFGKYI